MTEPSPAFLPSRDAFGFTNSWPTEPAVTIPTPFGDVGIGNAASGLCGGMVFAALDYWNCDIAPPQTQPGPGTPLYKFIVQRLIQSWHLPAGPAEYYECMVMSGSALCVRTVSQQWPQIKAAMDAAHPTALGIVTVASVNPGLLGLNHQVLGYAYELAGADVTIRVYDPNSGPDDGVYIKFTTSDPGDGTTFSSNINISEPVRGFFLNPYSPATPPQPAPAPTP